MGLPARIAIPILAVFAVAFLGIMGYFLKLGFGTTGSAFGPGVVAQQGDARIETTPAPIATEPPGTFTVPQTGTGPAADGGDALPGASTGGGPPAPVAHELQALRDRLAHNPNDRTALEEFGELEFAARRFGDADGYFARAYALDPADRRLGAAYAASLRAFVQSVPANDPRVPAARATLRKLTR